MLQLSNNEDTVSTRRCGHLFGKLSPMLVRLICQHIEPLEDEDDYDALPSAAMMLLCTCKTMRYICTTIISRVRGQEAHEVASMILANSDTDDTTQADAARVIKLTLMLQIEYAAFIAMVGLEKRAPLRINVSTKLSDTVLRPKFWPDIQNALWSAMGSEQSYVHIERFPECSEKSQCPVIHVGRMDREQETLLEFQPTDKEGQHKLYITLRDREPMLSGRYIAATACPSIDMLSNIICEGCYNMAWPTAVDIAFTVMNILISKRATAEKRRGYKLYENAFVPCPRLKMRREACVLADTKGVDLDRTIAANICTAAACILGTPLCGEATTERHGDDKETTARCRVDKKPANGMQCTLIRDGAWVSVSVSVVKGMYLFNQS